MNNSGNSGCSCSTIIIVVLVIIGLFTIFGVNITAFNVATASIFYFCGIPLIIIGVIIITLIIGIFFFALWEAILDD